MERLIEQLADGIGRERIYLGVNSAVLRPEGKDGWELHGTVTTTEDAMSDVSELSSACGEHLSEKKKCKRQKTISFVVRNASSPLVLPMRCHNSFLLWNLRC